ncbi:DUF4339 domain-containing protein [Prochlorothrix hollandica]|uniref:DUF4339 domain-containing protein n=1 Tax=Prochlorothrix hollandica TaxID=1223 RepID=UPI000347CA74|nr:DUF4339 domain-containing protein [Prochlorothrix hollandica]
MWYFVENETKQGPVDLEALQELVLNGRITPTTLVWQKGMTEWLPINQTEFKKFIDQYAPPPVPISDFQTDSSPTLNSFISEPSGQSDPKREINQLETWFKAYWICLAVGAPLTIIIIGIGGVIASLVFSYMMLFKFWKIIQNGQPRTTPGKAVGFLFIPFFNFYWCFVAYLGLAKDTNKYIRTRKIRSPKIDENLVLWYCITICLSIIPYVNLLAWVATLILWVLVMRQFKMSAVAILKSRI